MQSQLLWRCLLVHALLCSVANGSRLVPLSVSPSSDKSEKQSMYPRSHRNLIICSLPLCQPSLKISCKSVLQICAKLLTVKQTDSDRQTNNNENITSFAEVMNCYGLEAAWRSGDIVGCINEVTLRWARLVLRWVTVFGGKTTSVFHQAI